MNSPRDAVDVTRRTSFPGAEEQRCDIQSDFERYLKLINALKTFFAHTYRERRVLATGLTLELEKDSRNLQSFAALDQNKVQLVFDKGAKAYNVYAVSPDPKVAFCLSGATAERAGDFEVVTAGPAGAASKQNCFRPVVDVPAEDSTRAAIPESPLAFPGATASATPSRYCSIYNRFLGIPGGAKSAEYPKVELRLHIRSVGEIFQFLGDLIHYQDEIRRHMERATSAVRMNTPVTFGYCADDPSPGCDDVFLRLDGDACNARFSVFYRERQYHVGNYNSDAARACGARGSSGRDHTLEVLAVMHQLIGLHRSAADIRQTPTVQVLP
jgi:hypothetical protein